VVKTWVLTTAIVASFAGAAAAHPSTDTRDAVSADDGQQPKNTPDTDTIRARQKISIIEGAFERAVQNGADNFARQIRAIVPEADGMAMLMGAPVVRGFRLNPGGVFFDVQMPSLQLSMVWPLRFQESTAGRRGNGLAVSNLGAAPTAAPAPTAADTAFLDDPAEAWRREVRATLVDAMIDNTGGISIGPDEYIVVAARGVMPPDRLADPGDARTIELKLKGKDLQDYRANTITVEEARSKVGFREY
jgi:hypothetical protein